MVRAVPVFDFEEALVIERDGEALADEFDP
jgi:hypothetical protein